MARPASTHPTDGELEILQVLWDSGPSELGRICEALRARRPVANTTIATMLKVMLDKGLVQRETGGRGFRWSAKAGRDKTRAGLLRKLLERAFGGSAKALVGHLVEDCTLSDEDLSEIQRMLQQRKR